MALGLALVAGLGFWATLLWQRHHFRLIAAGEAAAAPPNPVDIGFAQFMGVHHDQAVTMSLIMLAHGASEFRSLATSIEVGQLIEMGEMRGWLLSWNKPLMPTTKSMDWLLMGRIPSDAALSRYIADCKTSAGGMPGLASTEELNQLRELDGKERDALFLKLMIRHHEAALPMARFASQAANTPMIRSLAAQIVVGQMMEINTMKLYLSSRDAEVQN